MTLQFHSVWPAFVEHPATRAPRNITPTQLKWEAIRNKVDNYFCSPREVRGMLMCLGSALIEKNINSKNWAKDTRFKRPDSPQCGRRFARAFAAYRQSPDHEHLDEVARSISACASRQGGYLKAELTNRVTRRCPEVFRCGCCGNLKTGTRFSEIEGVYVYCYDCVDEGSVVYCDIEDGWLPIGNTAPFRDYADYYNDPDDYQEHRVSSGYTIRQNLVWLSTVDAYVRQDVYRVYNHRGPISTSIHDYHSGPVMGHIPSAYDARTPCVLLGLELEVEVMDANDDDDDCIGDIAGDIISEANRDDKRYMKAEHDGSLDAGFEMITGWTGLDVHARNLKRITALRAWRELRSHDTSTCGLHVHIDRESMTPLHVVKLQTFINDTRNRPLIKCIARRYDASYAKIQAGYNWPRDAAANIMSQVREYATFEGLSPYTAMKQKLDSGRVVQAIQSDRYSALNWSNKNTVEFRFFRGSTKFTTIMACLEFTFAAWHFTRVTPVNKLTVEEFVKYICAAENRKDTKYLRSYLHGKRFVRYYEYEQQLRPKDKRFKDPVTVADQEARDGNEVDITLQEQGMTHAQRAVQTAGL